MFKMLKNARDWNAERKIRRAKKYLDKQLSRGCHVQPSSPQGRDS
jgi:hypothetical protein